MRNVDVAAAASARIALSPFPPDRFSCGDLFASASEITNAV
jgi:hypothetical protein